MHHGELVAHTREQCPRRDHACVRRDTASRIGCLCMTVYNKPATLTTSEVLCTCKHRIVTTTDIFLNCSLYILLTVTDQKPQKLKKRKY